MKQHDRFAPYWAAALALSGIIGLSTNWIDLGPFWKGYVLDITGPAWNYVLFRGLFTSKASNRWSRFFTPKATLFSFIIVLYGMEVAQFFQLYDATYDPWDFFAYVSLIIPMFLIDLKIARLTD